jgi:hypothetical protein
MSDLTDAKDALTTALKEVIRECGRGGSGRAAIFAPQINAISNALKVVSEQVEPPKEIVDRMALVRAAKKQQ